MPKVIETLVRHECSGQVWFTVEKLADPKGLDAQSEPRHLPKGVRHSPFAKDNFETGTEE